jgi:hypothetical protein
MAAPSGQPTVRGQYSESVAVFRKVKVLSLQSLSFRLPLEGQNAVGKTSSLSASPAAYGVVVSAVSTVP